ncbi:uncharacterized protein ACLA_022340 [Aspergillus clavatus NRRL 1]|uniref:Synaptobrevin n=1 Tax=Aspergillus clavatus (strain ATCC 1007 / CBS 513.65 / DSM 816 / NCTC 3887 / NRRL 1 / QM 1276 / 107) TaxID=344612 RepID=A1CPE9_ASPCL|nr:uncharacterized protein ACLA_022340 [Aspergillus clavatus NRRL 1]EAW07520.1 conserved hypothetical protein [Aspergillus clavatus NRRL 1]
MTITAYPTTSPSSSPDIAILNLSRLFTRLEHNLLSPSADLKSLRRSEYQRMRIGANVDYARTLLTQLERSLPHLKPLDRRHELQTDLTRKRETLKLLQDVVDKSAADAELRGVAGAHDADFDSDDDGDEAEEILLDEETTGHADAETATPETATSDADTRDTPSEEDLEGEEVSPATTITTTTTTTTAATPITATAAATTASSSSPPPASASASASVRHRYRHQKTSTAPTSTPATTTATATATATGISPPASKLAATEETLSLHRTEQEDLTGSLLSLASQLKASSHAFQSSLEAEKSVLARAAEGLDRTTSNMDAAEKRMGMLRRMTEGKGWLGRMMLYAWIFGLWVVAVLIVFLGPKLRF